jgi:hypothetical protein
VTKENSLPNKTKYFLQKMSFSVIFLSTKPYATITLVVLALVGLSGGFQLGHGSSILAKPLV